MSVKTSNFHCKFLLLWLVYVYAVLPGCHWLLFRLASPWRIVTVPGVLSCCVKVSGGEALFLAGNGFLDAQCQHMHLHLKQILKIWWANIYENNRPLWEIKYRIYMYGVLMDHQIHFLFETTQNVPHPPIRYLFYGRLYHEIVYIMQGKWNLNRYIIVFTWRWDIS